MLSPFSLQQGTIIDGYRILCEIGQGGMATIYEAEKDGVLIAIKMLRAHNPSAELIERFHREHRILTELSHRYILKVFHEGTYQGHPYFVMERLKGAVLAQKIDQWSSVSFLAVSNAH